MEAIKDLLIHITESLNSVASKSRGYYKKILHNVSYYFFNQARKEIYNFHCGKKYEANSCINSSVFISNNLFAA